MSRRGHIKGSHLESLFIEHHIRWIKIYFQVEGDKFSLEVGIINCINYYNFLSPDGRELK
jgi:desulfoferrodoxin (superoxide reductase-like protein)